MWSKKTAQQATVGFYPLVTTVSTAFFENLFAVIRTGSLLVFALQFACRYQKEISDISSSDQICIICPKVSLENRHLSTRGIHLSFCPISASASRFSCAVTSTCLHGPIYSENTKRTTTVNSAVTYFALPAVSLSVLSLTVCGTRAREWMIIDADKSTIPRKNRLTIQCR